MSLRSVLLALLHEEPNSGYGISRLLGTKLSHLWNARLQQIYGELANLQAAGLVEAEVIELHNRPAKKIYSVTPKGHQALDSWLARVATSQSSRDDLLIMLYCFPRTPREDLVRQLEARRELLDSEIRRLRLSLEEVEQRNNLFDAGYILTLDAALSASEAQLLWCARALAGILDFRVDRGIEPRGSPEAPHRRSAAGRR